MGDTRHKVRGHINGCGRRKTRFNFKIPRSFFPCALFLPPRAASARSLFLQMPLLLPSSLFPSRLKPYVLPKSLPRGRPWRSLLHLPPWNLATAPSPAVVSEDVDAFTKYSGYLFEGGASSEAEFLRSYDFPSVAAIYRRKPFLVLRRFLQISVAFGRWFAERYFDSVSDRSDEMFKVSTSLLFFFLLSLTRFFIGLFIWDGIRKNFLTS